MWRELKTWLRGLAQLRDPEIVAFLGTERQRRARIAGLRALAPNVRVSDSVVLLGYAPGRLELGDGAHVREGTVLALGDDAEGYGTIRVGARTWIGQYNNLRASSRGSISIGADCLISQFCTLVGTQHACARGTPITAQGVDPGRCGITLGDDVWLGAGVVVTPGTTIGDGAVIGANAVVTHDVPAGEIWGGVPARRVGERS